MKTDLFDSRRWSSRGDVRRRRPRDSATGTTGTAAGSCCPAIQKFKIILLLATKVPKVGLVRQVKLLTKPQEFHIPKKGEWKGICIRAIRRLKTALGGKKKSCQTTSRRRHKPPISLRRQRLAAVRPSRNQTRPHSLLDLHIH